MSELDQADAAPRAQPALPSWTHPLANARPGLRYRITELAPSMVRDRCRELGLERGDQVTCIDAARWSLCLMKLDGRRVTLERDYAWFVQVEALPALKSQAMSPPDVPVLTQGKDDSGRERARPH